MKVGHSSPSSNESTVPDTAPTANSTAKTFDQRWAKARQTRSPVRRWRHSAASTSRGMPTPNTASVIWR